MAETLYVATSNDHKLREIEALLSPLTIHVRPFNELGHIVIEEDAPTFLGNARRKVHACLTQGRPELVKQSWIMADDSGLAVSALGGAPGVRSSRYAGQNAGDQENNALLLENMKTVPESTRGAHFVCCVVLAYCGQEAFAHTAKVRGRILRAPRGTGGFGYDPLFWYEPLGRTFAELTAEEKNRVSHRGQSLRALTAYMRSFMRGKARLWALKVQSKD